MTPSDVTFVCFACHRHLCGDNANLDAEDHLICGECYLTDSPPDDVNGIFAED